MVYGNISKKKTSSYSRTGRKVRKYVPKSKYSNKNKSLTSMIKKITLKTQETKRSMYVNTSHSTLAQSKLIQLDATPLKTSNGANDPNASGYYQNRIGDEVNPVGLSIKFMAALDPRQSQMKLRFLLVKGPQGDIPTLDNLFCGFSYNKQLDSIDTERWTIVAQKYMTITRPNNGVSSTTYGTQSVDQSGWATGMEREIATVSGGVAQWIPKLCKVWVPGYKFGKVLKYQNGSQTPKMFGYTAFVIAYGCEQATDEGVLIPGTSLGRMDDYISTFYFKDA